MSGGVAVAELPAHGADTAHEAGATTGNASHAQDVDERESDTPVAENNGEEIKSAEANTGGVEEPAQAKEEDEAEVATRTISQLMQKSNTGGAKTIGLFGGVMLLINNLAGPTVVLMPALAQEAGWLAVIIVEVVVAAFATWCGVLLIAAMQRVPGNKNFELRIEFDNLTKYYLPHPVYIFVIICYHLNTLFTLVATIIQSAQSIDYAILNINGCAPGIIWRPEPEYMCGDDEDSITPFGHHFAVSAAIPICGLFCIPFAFKNLDDNIYLQYLAIMGLCGMSSIWFAVLVDQPVFPRKIPVATNTQLSLVGTILFNFAFITPLPSWLNEKRPEVSVYGSFLLVCTFVVVLYSALAIVGGMAYEDFYDGDETLFSKLNGSGNNPAKVTVSAYPILQNFTSIPTFSVFIRYNLMQTGIPRRTANFIAIFLPWIMSFPFYTGEGFELIAEWTGLTTSSVVNLAVPAALYVISRWVGPLGTGKALLGELGTASDSTV